MRKIMILMMALLLPFSALEMRADEEVQMKKIPIRKDTGPNLNRDLTIIPIESYYYGQIGSIYSVIKGDLGEVSLIVTNTSTGECWSNTFDSMTEHQSFLPISGTPGCYEIEYVTEFGDVYAGEFLIE